MRIQQRRFYTSVLVVVFVFITLFATEDASLADGIQANEMGGSSSMQDQPLDPPPMLSDSGAAGWLRYLHRPGHKAFAVSPRGNWGYRSNQRTVELARLGALRNCGTGCEIVSEDGVMLKHYPQASVESPPPLIGFPLSVSKALQGKRAWMNYVNNSSYRAFAMNERSDVGMGVSGNSIDEAKNAAMRNCGADCLVMSVNGYLFDSFLYREPPFVLSLNGKAAWYKYLMAQGHKAFALAPDGHYGINWGQQTIEGARQNALRRCSGNCVIVSVDGSYEYEGTYLASNSPPPPMLDDDGIRGWQEYLNKPGHKAFAMSPDGRKWASTWNHSSARAANLRVLRRCLGDCDIISADGIMQTEYPQGSSEIPPQGLKPTAEADRAWLNYLNGGGFRAFAVGPNGRFGSKWGRSTVAAAKQGALDNCGNSKCILISINGVLVHDYQYLTPPPSLDAAGQLAWGLYLDSPGHKAFTVSLDGDWSYAVGSTTLQGARQDASAGCSSDCQLFSVDDEYRAFAGTARVRVTFENQYQESVEVFSIDSFGTESKVRSLSPGTSFTANSRAYNPWRFKFFGDTIAEYIPTTRSSQRFAIGGSVQRAVGVGEACDASNPCQEGNVCMNLDAIGDATLSPSLRGSVCMPGNPLDFNETVKDLDYFTCLSIATNGLIPATQGTYLLSQATGKTMSLGAGIQNTASLMQVVEGGVVYGPGGKVGCYFTECRGWGLDVGTSAYGNFGIFDHWDDFCGNSEILTLGGSVPFVEISGSITGVAARDEDRELQQIGTVFTLSSGVGIVPIEISGGRCNTRMITVLPSRETCAVEWETVEPGERDWSNWSPTGL